MFGLTSSFVRFGGFVTLAGLSLLGCGPQSPGDDVCMPMITPMPSDLPPTDTAMLDEWLAARSWETWDCEAAPHPARGSSPHGTNRVCQNALVTACVGGSDRFPVGATLVKESFDAAGMPTALFVETRISDAPDASGWYFVRRGVDGSVVDNAAFCAGCHTGAPRDFVFTIVP